MAQLTSSSSAERIDRHIVTIYQITRGEVSISQVSRHQLAGAASTGFQENIVCELDGGGESRSSSSSAAAADGSESGGSGGGEKDTSELLGRGGSSRVARQLEQVKEGIYRLLSEGSEPSSLGTGNSSLTRYFLVI